MSPASGLAALAVAFTAGLTLTLVVVDSSSESSPDAQRVETAAAPAATEPSSSVEADPSINIDEEPGLLVVAKVGDDPSLPRIVQQDGTGIGEAPTPPEASISESTVADLQTAGGGQTTEGGPATAAPSNANSTTAAPSSSTAKPAPGSSQGGQATTSQAAKSPGATTPSGNGATTPTQRATTTRGADTTQRSTAPQSTKPQATAPKATSPRQTQPAPTTTAAPATAAPTTAAPTTAAPKPSPGGSGGSFESIRNRNPLFNRYENVPSNQLSLDALTEPASVPDNGSNGDGNFRMACQYSHFSYDDPIVFPGQPGKSHFHMFFGNTEVDAYTNTNSLVNSGGSTCNGFELNRSGYWTPAMLDGKGNTIVPDQIILYYKTKDPKTVKGMPQGLKMIAGNPNRESFNADYKLGWSCGGSGTSYNRSNRIPNNCGNDPVNAYIQFPFCWDGKNLDSSDHLSHMAYVNDNQACPSSHPVRLPQISILLYFPSGDTSGWHLSSDRSNGFNTGPGATLHADWFGGWNDEAMDLWINGCMVRARNCSYGQTGTDRMFAKLNPLQNYPGDNVLSLP